MEGRTESLPAPVGAGAHSWRGIALVVAAGAAFGTAPVVGKLAYGEGLELGEMLFFRFLVAGLVLLAVARAFEPRPRLRAMVSAPALLTGSLFSLQALCFFLGLESLKASVAELLLFSYPALVALAGWLFFAEPLSRRPLMAIAVTVAGAILIAGDIEVGFGQGLMFGLASPVLYVAYLFATRHVARALAPITLSVVTLLGGLPVLALVTILAGHPPALPSDPNALLILLALIGGPLIGIPCLLAGLAHVGVVRGAVISATEPAFTLAMAAVLLGESMAPSAILGAALLLTAVPLAADRLARAGSVPGP